MDSDRVVPGSTVCAQAVRTFVDSAAAEHQSLDRQLAWLLPSYPIGVSFYSHGLETAINRGVATSWTRTGGAWIGGMRPSLENDCG